MVAGIESSIRSRRTITEAYEVVRQKLTPVLSREFPERVIPLPVRFDYHSGSPLAIETNLSSSCDSKNNVKVMRWFFHS
jgi:hypothetical protein